MRHARQLAFFVLVPALAGCPGGIKTPAASQPVLEDVHLVGSRICGPFTTSSGDVFAFTCPALPTTEPSGWQLVPGWVASTANPQRIHSNSVATITVSTPSLTEIDVELAGLGQGGTTSLPLTLVDANLPGNPGEVFHTREVGMSNTDDGNKKTWKIDVVVSTCIDTRRIEIFNRSSSSVARSAPLSVQLIRAPNDETCVGQVGPITGTSSGVGSPSNSRPTGPCPGGASRSLFQVCENCANLHPSALSNYSAGQYCDWGEVLATYGYTGAGATKPQTCTLSAVSSRAACEGPP